MRIIIAMVLNISTSVLFAILGYILWKHTPKINSLFGFRFKNAYKSEIAWKSINQYGGKKVMQCSIVIALVSLLQLFYPSILFSFATALILIPIIQTYLYSRKFR